MIGDIYKGRTPISAYQPSEDVIALTKLVKADYSEGERILTTPWPDLNDRSVIDDYNRGQMMFNAFVDTSVEDPAEAWKWRGTRSMARNKGIAMHAQLTASYLLPMFVAQNNNDETDRDFSEIMRDIIEWMAEPTNSDYQPAFLQIVFGMMQNPVTYLGAEFFEIYQTIKEVTEEGKLITKEVLDDVLSGFKAPIFSANQILITNAHVRNMQRQRAIIKRRSVDYSELEAKYGEHPNWPYVQTGLKSIYNESDGLFYDVQDSNNNSLCSEETWLCRREDSEVPFVNGIYLGSEDVEMNPITHRDNRDKPKYNVIPFGYMRIGEHFFYYKSMMNALQWDNMAYDAMSEIVFNRAILENEMPIAITGSDEVDSGVVFPNAVIAFENENARATPLLPPANIIAGFNSLRETEKSMDEGSVTPSMAGQLPDASQKAFNVAQAQANAKKMIGAVGKSLAESVALYGDLMKDIAINHITVPEIEELVGDKMKMKYKTFVLENKKSGKKLGSKVVKFDENLIGLELSEDEKMNRALKLLETTGYPAEPGAVRLVNPELFAKFKYLAKSDPQELFTKSAEYWQPILLALKAQLANDPYTNQEGLTRKIMYSYFNSEGEDLMKDSSQEVPGLPVGGGDKGQASVGTQIGNIINKKAAANAANNLNV